MTKKRTITWSPKREKIDSLKQYAKNPRVAKKAQVKQIKNSLDKFGQCEPIVVNTDNVIIGGHQRVRALKAMGAKYVEVSVPDSPLSEKEVEELNIRLNRNHADWDDDILANCFESDDLFEWGFTEYELQYKNPIEEDENEKKREKREKVCPHCGESLK